MVSDMEMPIGRCAAFTAVVLMLPCSAAAQNADPGSRFIATLDSTGRPFDVVVVGATPGGIAAAITAARLGRTVAPTEYHPHIGGMSSSGLSRSDVDPAKPSADFFASSPAACGVTTLKSMARVPKTSS
jgi:NADPH-dependent 2,4-dienoyl-CoA reductase/sulfur reductase-like enzyme